MNPKEIISLLEDNINKLKSYNAGLDSYINSPKNKEQNIESGRSLIYSIQRGPLFEDDAGRNPDYESIVGSELFNSLNNELNKTSLIVKFLKGDISKLLFDKEYQQYN